MLQILLPQEDGSFSLGSMGYYILIAVLLAIILLSAIIVDRKQKTAKFSVKQLVICGVCLALGFLLSYLSHFYPFNLLKMPYGGRVTVFSMLIICLVGYFYGIRVGLLTAFAYSILQFIEGGGSYMLTPLQVLCDYFFAFTALGITGFFYKKENKLIPAYLLAILARGLFHTIGGYLYWMDYMPDNYPKNLAAIYPIVYNYSYILAEGIITVLVLCIPAVKKMIKKLQILATEA